MIGAADIAEALHGKRSGAGFIAKCPAHEDSSPSLSINDGDKGPVVHCHAGCTQDEVLDALAANGVELRKPKSNGNGHAEPIPFNVALLAQAKRLDPNLLAGCGVTDERLDDGATIVCFEYRDAHDDLFGVKTRGALSGDRGFRWRNKGSSPKLYGLWRVEAMRALDARFIVCEGETDALTLWQHEFSALGLPGANLWRPEWASEIPEGAPVYVIVEPDAGGEAVLKWLAESPLRTRARLVRMSAAAKDPSALYLSDPEHFADRFEALLAAALPFDAPPETALRLVSMADLPTVEPLPIRFVAAPILPREHVTLLAAHGDAGKSLLALTFAAHTACGAKFGELQFVTGRVLVVSLEDSGDLAKLRLRRIAAAYGLDLRTIAERVTMLEAGDNDDTALAVEQSDAGVRHLVLTRALEEVRTRAAGHDLIVVDNASDAYDANESERRLVRRFLRALQRMAKQHKAAVLLLAHIDKAGARYGTAGETYSGSTAWHNTVRSRLALLESDAGLNLVQEKCNLAKKLEHPIPLQRNDHGVPMPMSAAARELVQRADVDAVLAALKAADAAGLTVPTANTGPSTAAHVLSTRPALPEELAGDTKRINNALARLEREGAIERERYKNADSKSKERFRCSAS